MRDKNNHERVRRHKRDLQHFLIRIPAAIHPRRQPALFLNKPRSAWLSQHNYKSPARDKKNDPLRF